MVRSLRRWLPERSWPGWCLALSVLTALTVSLPSTPAEAAPPDPAEQAVAYLLAQQAPDGSFGDGSATPDAVSAIAQQAQSSDTWSAKEAIDAVVAAETPEGRTPLDALDSLAEDDPSPELAAQITSRAVVAMGLDPQNFDPGGDGNPVDLVHQVLAGRSDDGSFGSLSATAEAVLALVLVDRQVAEPTVAVLQDAQQHNGGWNADGDPDGTAVDPVTTGLVVEALVATGAVVDDDTAVTRALALLARTQADSGAWPAERGGADDPPATAWAMGAIRAAGFDPDQACWSDTLDAETATGGYASPATALAESQGEDGEITGAADGVETTALSVQGILGRWLPTVRGEQAACSPEDDGPGINLSLVFLAVFALAVFAGAVRIMRRGSR